MAGMLNNMANLANVKLTAALAATDTSVTVDDASPFQNLGDFYATLMPAGEMSRLSNSEIVLCSYATATTLSISRAQRGTTAKAFNAGDILTNGIYVEDLAQVQSVGNTIFDTMSSNNVYTLMNPSGNNMLPGTPTDGMKITIKVNYDSVGTPTIKTSSSATAFSVYTGSNVSGDDTLDPAILLAGNIYELVFNGTAWIVLNQVPKVTSDNIDWATINYGSTTEDVVVGVYNGAPVYRHVEEFTISSSGWVPTNLARPISNLGKLINVFGSIRQTSSGATNLYPLFRVRPTNATYGAGVATINSSVITFDIGTDVSGQKDITVFIDYTKSS